MIKPTNPKERSGMNDQFDELAKELALSVTRRKALRRFGAGLAGALLASLGLANKAQAVKAGTRRCEIDSQGNYTGVCVAYIGQNVPPAPNCSSFTSANCPAGAAGSGHTQKLCERLVDWRSSC